MSRPIRALRQARDELVEAATYVETQRPGFGLQLFDEYEATIKFAGQYPGAGSLVELPVDLEIRRFQMRRFHFAVFVTQINDELLVFAVSHHKRAPRHWANRLTDLQSTP